MNANFLNLVGNELFQMRKRTSTWVLLGAWAAMAAIFNYLLPWLTASTPAQLQVALPQNMVESMTTGFPFYGGAIALMIGVLSLGSEFGSGTFKTIFTQRAGRTGIITAKVLALILTMLPFSLLVFAIGGVSGYVVGRVEGLTMSAPAVTDVLLGMGAGWLILSAWAVVGALLAIITRGTALAVGIGIIWALLIEGLISAFADDISWLEWISNILIRSNSYSLIKPLGSGVAVTANGPGYFAGPFVSVTQSFAVLVAILCASAIGSIILMRRRDIA